jgi:hypothetical protein
VIVRLRLLVAMEVMRDAKCDEQYVLLAHCFCLQAIRRQMLSKAGRDLSAWQVNAYL